MTSGVADQVLAALLIGTFMPERAQAAGRQRATRRMEQAEVALSPSGLAFAGSLFDLRS
jgi:hypothetical protein